MFTIFKNRKKSEKKTEIPVKVIPTKVTLRYDDGVHWKWQCPKCNFGLSLTYSKRINHQWCIPDDKVYCAVCKTYYDFEKEKKDNEEIN